MKTISVSSLRKRNISEILKAISQSDGVSRAELARRAGVSVMTVSNIMDVLLSNGVVYEVEQKTENVGRNPSLVHLSGEKWMLVLDLSEYSFGCTALSLDLHDRGSFRHSYNWKLAYHENFEMFLQAAELFVDRLGLPRDDLFGVAASLPAAYNPGTDRTLCDRLPGLSELALRESIQHHFDRHIWIEEDVKLAAAAAASVLCPSNAGLLLYLYIGSGVGGAVMDDGRVFYGTDGCGGDIGQLEMRDGRRLEDLVSWDRFRTRLAMLGVEPENCTAEEIGRLWRDAGPASELMREYVADLGWAVYNAVCLFSPDSVLLEGGCRLLGPELIRRVEEYVHTRLRPATRHRPPVLLLKTDLAGAVLGAGMLLRESWVRHL